MSDKMKNLEEKKIDKLYELLEKGNFDNETSATLKWAIFELESIYSVEIGGHNNGK